MSEAKKIPAWLVLSVDGVTIHLSKPSSLNGIVADKVTMRAPTVRDVRAASVTANGDEEQRELNLFATLAEVGVKDLDDLHLKDYKRLQSGYFRMVDDDGL